ncbi:MAG: 30S ribosomal protein S3 [Patescibacteria group bacterium]
MGHKIPPYVLRIGLNRNWRSIWFFTKIKNKYPVFLEADYLIRKTIEEIFPKANIVEVIIERKSLDHCKLEIYTAKPGLVIGKDGQNLKKLYQKLEKILKPHFTKHNFSYPSLEINVVEVKKPYLYAQYLAEVIANYLEQGVKTRSAIKNVLNKAKEHKEIKGIKIKVSGRIDGAEIHRTESISWGKLPLSKLIADIDYGFKAAFTKYGIVGVKVWLYRGDKVGYLENVGS